MKFRNWIGLFVLLALVLCFFYVWPGMWRYKYHDYEGTKDRVDRLTGEVQVWLNEGGGYIGENYHEATTPHWHGVGKCRFCRK